MRSSRPASRQIPAKTKTGPLPAGVDAPVIAPQTMSAAIVKAAAQAPISNLPVMPSLRRAATQAVTTK